MCERLEGLYKSFDVLIGSKSSSAKLDEEFTRLAEAFKGLLNDFNVVNDFAYEAVQSKEAITNEMQNMVEKKANFEDLKIRLMKGYKDSISILKADLESVNFEKDKLLAQNQDLENSVKKLLNELDTFKVKYPKYSYTASLVKTFEKVCQNCRQVFKDAENFNWSCKTHPSAYSGILYWCCGNTDKNSQGCKSSMHVTGDIIEDQELEKPSVKFCSVTHI